MSMQDIRAGTGRLMPELGANPIEVAFHDYQRMEHELAIATQEHAAKSDMVNDLLRENEFLRRNYDKAVAERDRYQALAVNLATRAVGVREAVERLLSEAVSARAAPVADDGGIRGAEPVMGKLEDELTQLVERATPSSSSSAPVAVASVGWQAEHGVVKREITRTATLAPNEYR